MYGTGRSPWLYSMQYLTGERHHRVHVAGCGDRASEVRDDAYLVRVAHGHDLEHLGDTADVRERRTREVDVAMLDEGTEVGSGAPFLAGCQGNRRQQPQLRNLGAKLLLTQRVFDAERPVGLHQPADFNGFVKVELLVQVDHPVAIRADAVAYLFDRLNDQADARSRIEH